jgi:hypothetical protein
VLAEDSVLRTNRRLAGPAELADTAGHERIHDDLVARFPAINLWTASVDDTGDVTASNDR